MKYCSSCGNELKEGTKFCNSCGNSIATGATVSVQESSVKGEQVINLNAINIDKEKITTMSSGYFAYFKKTLAHPTESFNEAASYNGIIQFILLSVIQVIGLWFVSLDSYIPVDFGVVVGLLLILIIFNFLSAMIVHGVKKVAYHSKDSFLTTSTQYGGFFSSYVVLQTIIMVVALFLGAEMTSLTAFSYVLSAIVATFAFANYLYKIEGQAKLDKFYIGIIASLLLFIAWFIILRIGAGTIVTVLEERISNTVYGLF